MNRRRIAVILIGVWVGLASCTADLTPATQMVVESATATLTPTQIDKPTSTKPLPPSPSSTTSSEPDQVSATFTKKPTPWKPDRPAMTCEPSASMSCLILYIFIDQYDDEHMLRMEPIFERAGFSTLLASNTLDEIRGYHECYDFTPANPDMLLGDVRVADYDAIIFIGSDGWSTDLHDDPEAHRIANEAFERDMVIAATGDAPVILAKAGLLDGKTVTVKKDVPMHGIGDQFYKIILRYGAVYADTSPVRDGLLITADFGTADVARAILQVIFEQQQ